jgi:hypothetical protein
MKLCLVLVAALALCACKKEPTASPDAPKPAVPRFSVGNMDASVSPGADFGRYAFGNHPKITSWKLARFAEALLPILDEHEATAVEVAFIGGE